MGWTPEREQAFSTLRQALSSALELMSFNPDVPFIIRTDASEYAVGAVLEQIVDESVVPTVDLLRDAPPGTTKPVAFYSRKLTPGLARKWTVEEKETYVIVSALEKYSGVVGVQHLLVLTYHRTLQSWHKRAIDTPAGMSGHRARWHEKLSRFDISIKSLRPRRNWRTA